jgi:hypothetical protein
MSTMSLAYSVQSIAYSKKIDEFLKRFNTNNDERQVHVKSK